MYAHKFIIMTPTLALTSDYAVTVSYIATLTNRM